MMFCSPFELYINARCYSRLSFALYALKGKVGIYPKVLVLFKIKLHRKIGSAPEKKNVQALHFWGGCSMK